MDSYDDKAKIFADRWKPIRAGEGSFIHMMAAFGRRCHAAGLEEAAKECDSELRGICQEKHLPHRGKLGRPDCGLNDCYDFRALSVELMARAARLKEGE